MIKERIPNYSGVELNDGTEGIIIEVYENSDGEDVAYMIDIGEVDGEYAFLDPVDKKDIKRIISYGKGQ